MRLRLVAKETGTGISRNISLGVAVVLTVAITLASAGVGLLIREQVGAMKDYWYGKINVSIYLCSKTSLEPTCNQRAVTEAERTQIRTELNALPQVQKVYYESSAEAYANYKRLFRNSPDLVKNVDPSALPESFRVKLKNPQQFGIVAARFDNQPGVQLVQDQRDLLNRLFKLLNIFQLIAFVIAAFLVVSAVLLIFNAIRVAAISRRRETGIMRLVGASRTYVQLPFVLEGALLGLLGSAVGAGLLVLFKWVGVDKLLKPAIPSIPFIGWDWALPVLSLLVGGGVLVAAVASFLTVSWTLRRT